MPVLLIPEGNLQATLFDFFASGGQSAQTTAPPPVELNEPQSDTQPVPVEVFVPTSYPEILTDTPALIEPDSPIAVPALLEPEEEDLTNLPVVYADVQKEEESEKLWKEHGDPDPDPYEEIGKAEYDFKEKTYKREKLHLKPEFFDPEFFPTPAPIARKMLRKVSKDAKHFLEPSAGWGSLAEVISEPNSEERQWRHRSDRELDVIEANPELRAILQDRGYHVVGFDWLEYDGVAYYSAILMNPPFSQGAKHLLKAWDFLHEGEIVCLLNAETVKNPYTEERKRLARIIKQHGNVEWLGQCFQTATRKSDVEVAMVYLKKEDQEKDFDLWETSTQERDVHDAITEDNLPATIDQLGNLEHFFHKSLEEMFQGFQHIRRAQRYMEALRLSEFHRERTGAERTNYADIVKMSYGNYKSARAEFSRKLRRDAWYTVFTRTEFHKWLDKKQTEEFLREVERNGEIPFTADNIKGTLENVFLQRRQLFEKSCWNVFTELTRYDAQNTNYHEGWKTNDNYKVNKKVIFPYGCRWDDCLGYRMNYHGEIDIYYDLDRVLAVLDGRTIDQIYSIGTAMDRQFQRIHKHAGPEDKKCFSQYFKIQFWKKGTVHLTFLDEKLLERFNQTAAAGKKWVGSNTQKDSDTQQ